MKCFVYISSIVITGNFPFDQEESVFLLNQPFALGLRNVRRQIANDFESSNFLAPHISSIIDLKTCML